MHFLYASHKLIVIDFVNDKYHYYNIFYFKTIYRISIDILKCDPSPFIKNSSIGGIIKG